MTPWVSSSGGWVHGDDSTGGFSCHLPMRWLIAKAKEA